MLVGSLLHTSTSNSPIAAAHISLYTLQPLTQQAISFSQAITLARSAISSINAHHMRLVKLFLSNLVCAKIISCEYFYDENLLDEKKANYGSHKPNLANAISPLTSSVIQGHPLFRMYVSQPIPGFISCIGTEHYVCISCKVSSPTERGDLKLSTAVSIQTLSLC